MLPTPTRCAAAFMKAAAPAPPSCIASSSDSPQYIQPTPLTQLLTNLPTGSAFLITRR